MEESTGLEPDTRKYQLFSKQCLFLTGLLSRLAGARRIELRKIGFGGQSVPSTAPLFNGAPNRT